ncbi:Uncharacterised protein [BD1-7 clade bacterium]|uniref:Uncharacterized protein n=1 Tax=BD1-7 clade bacterium TaxID=2029982 RepID=A0A5S9PZ77_9GAMM|nr:Uncharacterised protein [BD1-7 clade bacterium]CAA0112912.1 Uncharacterised protein [BD1-7 clade bacterium]
MSTDFHHDPCAKRTRILFDLKLSMTKILSIQFNTPKHDIAIRSNAIRTHVLRAVSVIIMSGFIVGCGSESSQTEEALKPDPKTLPYGDGNLTHKSIINNQTAYISPQCYTKTQGADGKTHNPCFSCHTQSKAPNHLADDGLQEAYDFSNYSKTNRWSNLFKDRSKEVAAQSDAAILRYVRQNNYVDQQGNLLLAEKLNELPENWDTDDNGQWNGYRPDSYFNFDENGYDRNPEGEYTGWRAFAYYPFLGTFWPTNGSTDDVLIRLPEVFSLNTAGDFDLVVSQLNHAIVESLIKQKSIAISPTDETIYGVDLDQNGELAIASTVVFQWQPPTFDFKTDRYRGYTMWYVGKATEAQRENQVKLGAGLYPVGTEFLHSVRYIDLDDSRKPTMAARMKELRYAKKHTWNSDRQHKLFAEEEAYERLIRPEVARVVPGNMEYGLDNGTGWTYQGFIEDQQGDLRPQTYEETLFCMGCHSTVGAIADSTFVFQRKFEHAAFQHGWYHWSDKGLEGIAEPRLPNGQYEYSTYLQHNGAGDEFRANDELQARFFNADGSLNAAAISDLRKDVSTLLLPSAERALMLNKAYRVIVNEQSYIYGRDAHVKPLSNVHKAVEVGESTGLNAVDVR